LAKLSIKTGACYFNKNFLNESIHYLKCGIKKYNTVSVAGLQKSDINYIISGALLLANCYRLVGNFDSAIICLDTLKQKIETNQLFEDNCNLSKTLAEIYTWKALVYFDNGHFEKSISNNFKAIRAVENEVESDYFTQNNFAQLGRIFLYSEDYIKAESYHIRAANIIKNCSGDGSLLYAEQLSDLGIVYYESHQYQKALWCFKSVQNILENKLPQENIQFAFSYNNLADVYSGKKLFSWAIPFYKKALNIFLNHNYIDEACVVYHNLGIVYFNNGMYDLSEKYYNLALDASVEVRPNKNIYTSYTYQRLGQLYMKQHKYNIATKYYAKAVKELVSYSCDSTYYEIQYLQNSILSRAELFKSLYHKGYCELKDFQRNQNEGILIESIHSFQKALQIQDILRKQYNNEKTILSLNKLSTPLNENYLYSLLRLHEVSPSILNDNRILEAIERNKYTALRTLIYSTKVNYNSSLPDCYITSIDSIYKRIRRRENAFSKSLSFNKQKISTHANENLLFEDRFSLDTLISSLKLKYPAFNKSQYSFSYYKINEIQSLLPDSTGIIEYFISDSLLLIFAISNKTHIIIHSAWDDNIIERKNNFIKSILFSNTFEFNQSSVYFYNELIRPIQSVINGLKSLVIIPDQVFANLPFEALINPDNRNNKLNNLSPSYLIKNYDISYYFSLNLWGDNIKSSLTNENINWKYEFSGFAPLSSRNDNSQINSLPHTKVEVNNIARLFRAKKANVNTYFNIALAEKEISKQLINSRIVHIASHGDIRCGSENYHIITSAYKNQKTETKKAQFSTQDGRLHLIEIYNLDIKSDLVTLSLCSSGFGENNLGEGITSLAHGFYYSGAKNILYTIWNVSDTHTEQFMTTFYYYISIGLTYPRALRRAKLDYIYSSNQLPVFWSAYLLNG